MESVEGMGFVEGSTINDLAGDQRLNATDIESGDFDDDFEDFGDFDEFEDFEESGDLSESSGGSSDKPDEYFPDNKINLNKIIKSEEVSDGEFAVDLSPEDLEFGVFAEESEDDEDDEDLEAYNEMKETLQEAGYVGLENADFDDLSELMKREKIIANKAGVEKILTSVLANSKASLESASNILAMTSAADNSNDFSKYATLRSNIVYDDKSSKLAVVVSNIISELESSGDEITAESVFKIIYNNVRYKQRVTEWEPKELINVLRTMVPKILTTNNNNSIAEEKRSNANNRVAKYILQDEFGKLKEAILDVSSGNYSVVRQVISLDDEYKIKCGKCKNLITLNHAPIEILRVSTGKRSSQSGDSRNVFSLPVFFKCSCGCMNLFLEKDYESVQKLVLQKFSTEIKDASSAISQICKDASYLKVDPPVEVIKDSLLNLLVDEGISTAVNSSSEDDVKLKAVVSNQEIWLAAKEFYAKIRGLNPVSHEEEVKRLQELSDYQKNDSANVFEFGVPDYDEDTDLSSAARNLTYREVARYVAYTLSKDYNSLHNQAIFSLIFYIKENDFWDKRLDYSGIWQLEDEIAFLEKHKVGFRVDNVISMNALTTIAYDAKVRLDELTEQNVGDYIDKCLGKLKNRLEKKKAIYSDTITMLFMERNIHALGYCPMINLSSINVANIDCYIPSSKVKSYFDYVADIIIINNLAGDFYTCWEAMHVMNASSKLNNSLNKNATLISSRNAIRGMLDKYTGKDGPQFSDSVLAFSYPVIKEHEPLRNAVNYVKAQNFYRFCREIYNAKISSSYINQRFSDELSLAINTISDVAKEVLSKSECEYFLYDFTKDEIATIDDTVKHFIFGRWVPRRLENETPEDYMKRFSQLRDEGKLDENNSYDYSEDFDRVAEQVAIIVLASNLSSIEYKAFAPTIFMSKVITEIVDEWSYEHKSAQKFLNISDELLNVIDENIAEEKVCENFAVQGDFNRILLGFYFSNVYKDLQKLSKEYNDRFMYISDSFSNKRSVIDYAQIIDDFLGDMAVEEQTDPNKDPESVRNEMLIYVKSKEMEKVLAGDDQSTKIMNE